LTPHDSLRIALLNPVFWPEVRRGSERLIDGLARGLTSRGNDVRLITSHPGRVTASDAEGFVVIRNRRLPEAPAQLAGLHEHTGHVPASYLTLRRGDDDVAHAFYMTDALAAVRWSRRTGRPAIYSPMGVPIPQMLHGSRLRRTMWRRATAGSAAVVALSEAAARPMRSLGVEPRVIPPGVDLDAFRRIGERASEPTILCTATVSDPRKRIDLLLEAHALLRESRPGTRLVLSRPREADAIRRLGLPREGVEIRNLDAHADLLDAYSSAWVTVLPSVAEAFGLVLVESLACGTPVVGTNDGGIPEIVDRAEIGRLFSGDRPETLATAIDEAMGLVDQPGTEEACRRRSEAFPLRRTLEEHISLYRELVLG
jgi:phosphatidylinositol alpha-mannosyltransferase